MSLVKVPPARLCHEKRGNDFSSLFSNSETLLRGKKLKTTEMAAKSSAEQAMYKIFCFKRERFYLIEFWTRYCMYVSVVLSIEAWVRLLAKRMSVIRFSAK